MGFLVNTKTKKIHKDNCSIVSEYFKKTKNKRDCNYKIFNTKKSAEQFFINNDKEYTFCKFCNK